MKKKTHATPPSLRLSRQSLPGFGGAGGDQGFEPRLRAYSSLSTAALATAAALSAAATASAQIHNITALTNTGANFGTTLTLAANSIGAHHVSFGFAVGSRNVKFAFTGARFYGPSLREFIGGAAAATHVANRGLVRDLGKPAKVAPGGAIEGAQFGTGGPFFSTHHFPTYQKGDFAPGAGGQVTGYLGFKEGIVNNLFNHTNYYFGWLRIRVTADVNGLPHSIALDPINGIYGAFALAGSGITAGQISAIPEPASVATGLALFALGAAGVREHRRRRQLAA